jgi:hypothetical protein
VSHECRLAEAFQADNPAPCLRFRAKGRPGGVVAGQQRRQKAIAGTKRLWAALCLLVTATY